VTRIAGCPFDARRADGGICEGRAAAVNADAGLVGVAGLVVVHERAPGAEVAHGVLALDETEAVAAEDSLLAVTDVATDTPVQERVVVVRLCGLARGVEGPRYLAVQQGGAAGEVVEREVVVSTSGLLLLPGEHEAAVGCLCDRRLRRRSDIASGRRADPVSVQQVVRAREVDPEVAVGRQMVRDGEGYPPVVSWILTVSMTCPASSFTA
jgi:hypothetical protein